MPGVSREVVSITVWSPSQVSLASLINHDLYHTVLTHPIRPSNASCLMQQWRWESFQRSDPYLSATARSADSQIATSVTHSPGRCSPERVLPRAGCPELSEVYELPLCFRPSPPENPSSTFPSLLALFSKEFPSACFCLNTGKQHDVFSFPSSRLARGVANPLGRTLTLTLRLKQSTLFFFL